ncbi:unnamed protein product [Diamesa tonsa]
MSISFRCSRGLATFSVTANPDLEYDDLSDLNSMEMDSVREWEMQFKGKLMTFFFLIILEKYDIVGKLLKPGEQPTNYSDEDDEPNTDTLPVKTTEKSIEKIVCKVKKA